MARIVSDGCTDVQGYLISRPMPPDQIEGFLSSRNEILSRETEPA
jgi:EAL domain-containing protein (putative c-di-GMP-specific phosphodiesterase class I)